MKEVSQNDNHRTWSQVLHKSLFICLLVIFSLSYFTNKDTRRYIIDPLPPFYVSASLINTRSELFVYRSEVIEPGKRVDYVVKPKMSKIEITSGKYQQLSLSLYENNSEEREITRSKVILVKDSDDYKVTLYNSVELLVVDEERSREWRNTSLIKYLYQRPNFGTSNSQKLPHLIWASLDPKSTEDIYFLNEEIKDKDIRIRIRIKKISLSAFLWISRFQRVIDCTRGTWLILPNLCLRGVLWLFKSYLI